MLHHNIVALTGEDARQVFFSDPHLNFNKGYKILMGAVRVSSPQSPIVLLILVIPGATNQ